LLLAFVEALKNGTSGGLKLSTTTGWERHPDIKTEEVNYFKREVQGADTILSAIGRHHKNAHLELAL
jgi:hypothetical protein